MKVCYCNLIYYCQERESMNLQCVRYGYLTGQPVLQCLSLLLQSFLCFLFQDHLTQRPAVLPVECGLQTAFLAQDCLKHWATGRFLQVLSSLCSDLHVLLQRHLPSMRFEEQVFFPVPVFCRRYTSREPGPAWSILGLAGH